MKATLLSIFGDDLLVVNSARVSMGKWHKEFDVESDSRLIRYLAREQHFTPFCHPKAMFRLELPIFVARQWEKHRIGVVRGYDVYDHNEISRRYVDDEPVFFRPSVWRGRAKDVKQGSAGSVSEWAQNKANEWIANLEFVAQTTYDALLEQDVAPEQARMVLPQSTYTQWIETGSLSYWARLCTLRLDPQAQEEIRHLAGQVADQMAAAFPVSWSALMENAHE